MESPAAQDEADMTLASQFQFILEGRQQGVNKPFQTVVLYNRID